MLDSHHHMEVAALCTATLRYICPHQRDQRYQSQPKTPLWQDVLIYGIGAQTNDFNTPGVLDHAFFFKELSDARKVGKSEPKDFQTQHFLSMSPHVYI